MAGALDFRSAYASALLTYLANRDEPARRAAYELGRDAVRAGLGLMEVVDVHHESVIAALAAGAAPASTTRAAGELLLETLSAFEMVRRGAGEAREAADRERRNAAILRRLSSFLGDASLATSGHESSHEILNLLAEQALELIGGACCVATLDHPGRPRARASAFGESHVRLRARLALGDLAPLDALLAAPTRVARVDAYPRLAETVPGLADDLVGVESWLGAPLVRLDRERVGCIHVFDDRPRSFDSEDEAVLLHLAELGSAAIERAGAYAFVTATGSS